MKVMQVLLIVTLVGLASGRLRFKESRKRMKSMRRSFDRASILTDATFNRMGRGRFRFRKLNIRLATKAACVGASKSFRTADGSCNNRRHPSWGQTNSTYLRMVQNLYDDGESIPRQRSFDGNGLLPSPRLVCRKVAKMSSSLSPVFSYMVMQWGQFIDHDLQATPALPGSWSECCSGVLSNYTYKSGDCFPIIIPENDVHFKTNCMKFTRSRPFDESSKPREQFNAITSYIDGSVVYGSSDDEMDALRTGIDGLMLTSAGNLLPEDDNVDACRKKEDGDFCFLAGDARVNVFPGLAALHTVFVRFHNRLASNMAFIVKIAGYFFRSKRLPLLWNDERIFQTTRKIVSAVIQKINNDEFLPIVLGPKNIEKYQLWAPYKYDKYLNPMIINSFATAAFRYGHSQIPDTMKIAGEEVPIHKLYFKTNSVIRHFSDLVKTIVGNLSEKSDVHFSREVANKLFLLNNHSLDLFSLNIQRGRDHGLGSFNDYRRECNLQPATSFSPDIFGSCSQSLKDVYASVDDVDLFVGGMCEPPEEEAILGPTFACIVGRQFRNLKHGDRFWYETKNIHAGLGKGMIKFVKQITMSRILCDHGDISEIQPFSFLAADSKKNSVRPCADIPNYSIRALFGLLTGRH